MGGILIQITTGSLWAKVWRTGMSSVDLKTGKNFSMTVETQGRTEWSSWNSIKKSLKFSVPIGVSFLSSRQSMRSKQRFISMRKSAYLSHDNLNVFVVWQMLKEMREISFSYRSHVHWGTHRHMYTHICLLIVSLISYKEWKTYIYLH